MNTGKSQNIIGKFIDVIFKEKNLGINLAPPRTVDGKGAMVTSIAEKGAAAARKLEHTPKRFQRRNFEGAARTPEILLGTKDGAHGEGSIPPPLSGRQAH